MTVLVTGATGNVGSAVVRALEGRELPVRAFVREPARAADILGAGIELAVGDFGDPASIRRALAGVDRVFLSSANGYGQVAQETAVIDACAAARVRLIVKASTLGADPESALPGLAWNGRIEERLRGSGVPATILRSSFYMTNLPGMLDQGRLLAPAAEGRVAMIDPADVGAVGATLLADPGEHAGRIYRLTGPEAITFGEAASALGVKYVDVRPTAARGALTAAGLPDWLVDQLDGAFALVRAGAFDEVTDTVRVLSGREPTPFTEFASRLGSITRVPA